MHLRRGFGDVVLTSDGLVRIALDQAAQDAFFPNRQPRRVFGVGFRGCDPRVTRLDAIGGHWRGRLGKGLNLGIVVQDIGEHLEGKNRLPEDDELERFDEGVAARLQEIRPRRVEPSRWTTCRPRSRFLGDDGRR